LKKKWKHAYEKAGMPQIFHTPSKDRASNAETYCVGGERGALMRDYNTRFINSVFYNNFSISCVMIGLFLSSIRVQMDKI